MNERRHGMAPALAAAAALHAALLWALVFMTHPLFLPTGTAVPITLVASGPTTDSRPAEAAPVAEDAQVETPVPEAKAPVPPPAPKAQAAPPAPPKPAPRPQPAPMATRPARPAAPARPAPPKDTFSLDALQASIARAARSAPAQPATARRGPARAETAPVPRVDAGSGVSQSDIAGLAQLLERLWNPDCSVDGPDRVVIPVHITVGDDGRLTAVSAGGRESSADPVVFAAARRAIDAVHLAAPYGAPFRGKSFPVNFHAEHACAQR